MSQNPVSSSIDLPYSSFDNYNFAHTRVCTDIVELKDYIKEQLREETPVFFAELQSEAKVEEVLTCIKDLGVGATYYTKGAWLFLRMTQGAAHSLVEDAVLLGLERGLQNLKGSDKKFLWAVGESDVTNESGERAAGDGGIDFVDRRRGNRQILLRVEIAASQGGGKKLKEKISHWQTYPTLRALLIGKMNYTSLKQALKIEWTMYSRSSGGPSVPFLPTSSSPTLWTSEMASPTLEIDMSLILPFTTPLNVGSGQTLQLAGQSIARRWLEAVEVEAERRALAVSRQNKLRVRKGEGEEGEEGEEGKEGEGP